MFTKKKVERRGKERKTYSEIIAPLKAMELEMKQFSTEQEGKVKRITKEISEREAELVTTKEANEEATNFLGNLRNMFKNPPVTPVIPDVQKD